MHQASFSLRSNLQRTDRLLVQVDTEDSTLSAPSDPDLIGQTIQTFRIFCGMVLFSFPKYGPGLRERICQNFVARGMGCTESIFAVWRAGTEQDAGILHRSLLDRLIHLRHLAETDGFEKFEEHSFMSLYEMRHQLLSDHDMRHKVPELLRELQRTNRSRYDQLQSQMLRWRRPKAEDVVKGMDLGFLYRFGYNYASTHVHPMATDGEADFVRLTSPSQMMSPGDATVVRNSLVFQSMLVQEALNVSAMKWRAIVYDFLDQVNRFAGEGSPDLHLTFYKIGKAGPDFELCSPAEHST